MPQTIQVAVDRATIHFDKLYTYRLRPQHQANVYPGSMVLVPFGIGNRPRMAVVLDCDREEPNEKQKLVLDVAPEEARLTDELLKLVFFLKEQTFCTYYEAVKTVIPYGAQYRAVVQDGEYRLQSSLQRRTETWYSMAGTLPEKPKPSQKQKLAVKLLTEGEKPLRQLEEAGVSRAVLENLCQKGILTKATRYCPADLYTDILRRQQEIQLTEEQQAAYDGLQGAIGGGKPTAALLHGVTGSGKTMVFLKLIETALVQGKTALVLVPEIGLTPQMILRLKETFGDRVAVQHSALNHTERLAQWQMIQQGGADIVVGTRSAVFAPLQNLGLIIIDEEQEHTYYSESSPRFAAADVARLRAAQNNALLLFASATPSVETYYQAENGRYELYCLNNRYAGNPLPPVEMVDMRAELAAGNTGEISTRLAEELQANLETGEQSILLLNRRGYHTLAACMDCGKVVKCASCSVPMVYHKAKHQLMCHYCGSTISPAPTVCPECGGRLRYSGFGTQKVEEELTHLFPKARVLRMDQDTTGTKNAHEIMLAQFARQEYDILIGTQMVAKGLDFARVSLVGVLGIDSLLFGQGFRSYENVFSLVTQVIGRSGRAELPGRAILQTIDPEHPVLALAAAQDYQAFYRQEIAFRKMCLYPPFCSVCIVGFTGENEVQTQQAAIAFGKLLGSIAAQQYPRMPLRVLGPAPMSIAMIKKQYRFRLVIKCRNSKDFRTLLRLVLDRYAEQKLPTKATVTLDFHSDSN